MKFQVDVHLYGSVEGYREISASNGLSIQEKDVLASTGFGDVSDQSILNSLEQSPTACGRPLPSGRIAITRCFPGPIDEGGRPTIELRTYIFHPNDWDTLRSGRLELFLNHQSNWDQKTFLNIESFTLKISNEHVKLHASNEMFAMFTSLSNNPKVTFVCDSNQNTDKSLFTLLSKLTKDDSRYISWGVKMIGTGLKLSISTIHPKIKGISNSIKVDLSLPETTTALSRDFLKFSDHLPSIGYKPGTVLNQSSNSMHSSKNLSKNKSLILLVWVFFITCVLVVLSWPSDKSDTPLQSTEEIRSPQRTYPKGSDPNSRPIPKTPVTTTDQTDKPVTTEPSESFIDCDQNEKDDAQEIIDRPELDSDNDSVLDMCQILENQSLDCDGNTFLDSHEILLDPTIDENENSILDSCEIQNDATLDCNSNLKLDEYEIKNDSTLDCDANAILDECEIDEDPFLDRNLNNSLDICEIHDHPSIDCDLDWIIDTFSIKDDPSLDCNNNLILDVCEISDQIETDCNQNLIPDSCDLTNQTSFDINKNLIPDECDFELSFDFDFFSTLNSSDDESESYFLEFNEMFENYSALYELLTPTNRNLQHQKCIYELSLAINLWAELIQVIDEVNLFTKDVANICEFKKNDPNHVCKWEMQLDNVIDMEQLDSCERLPYDFREFQHGLEILRGSRPNFNTMLDAVNNNTLTYKATKWKNLFARINKAFPEPNLNQEDWSNLTLRLDHWSAFESFKAMLALVHENAKSILSMQDSLEEDEFEQIAQEIHSLVNKLSPVMIKIKRDLNDYREKGIELQLLK